MKTIFYLVLCTLMTGELHAQGALILHVSDARSGMPLQGVNVALPGLQRGVSTDAKGECLLQGVPDGAHELHISHVAYHALRAVVEVSDKATRTLSVTLETAVVPTDEVTVTAARWEQLLRDTPLPIALLSRSDAEGTPAVTLSDALAEKAGIALQRDGLWASQVSIRGLGRSNVVTLVDGTRLETATNIAAAMSLVDLRDVERIEVIKGAASSLYGSGATGGVINIVSAASSYSDAFRLGGSLSGSLASVNDEAAGSLQLRAGASTWHASLRGSMRSAGDARTPTGVLRSRYRDHSVAASLAVLPVERHELAARYQRYRASDVGIPGGAAFPDAADARYPYEARELFSAEWTARGLFAALPRLNLQVSQQLIERDVELRPAPGVAVRPHADHRTLSALLQTQWLPGAGHQLSAGVDAWQREYDGYRRKENEAKQIVITDLPVPTSTFRSLGIYLQDRIPLVGTQLALVAGGRIDAIEVRNEEALDPLSMSVGGVVNPSPPGQRVLWEAATNTDVSWGLNLGMLYDMTEALQITVNGARAYRSPSLEERYQYIQLGSVTYLGNPALNSERSSTLDLGLRFRGSTLRIEGNMFMNIMGDLVVDTYEADTLYIKGNIGSALLYGGELSMSWHSPLLLTVDGSLSYVRGRDTGEHTDLPEIAPLTSRLGVSVPLGRFAQLRMGTTLAATQEHVAPGEPRTPGYALFDASLRSKRFLLGGGMLQLFITIENLFDRSYRQHLSTYRGIVLDEPGRNLHARVAWSW